MLLRSPRRRARRSGLVWVAAEAAERAGFSSVMLKAITHARRGGPL